MDMIKPMLLVLIEDNDDECVRFKDCANQRTDVKFAGITDSAENGIHLVQEHLPEGVILDLQLAKGQGSGLQFLETLNKTKLPFRPIVMVTTTNISRIVRDSIEELGADWYYSKKKKDYSENLVFDTLLSLRKHIRAGRGPAECRDFLVSPEDERSRCYQLIDAELDRIGVRVRYVGRTYLREGIYLQINAGKEPVIDLVADKYKHAYNTISAGMQTAINDAWANSAPEELERLYTAKISAKTGTPSPTDFLHYFAKKIRNTL
jgi:ActR/RegA family two-component response regulator